MLPKLASVKEYDMESEVFLALPIQVISKIKEQLSIFVCGTLKRNQFCS